MELTVENFENVVNSTDKPVLIKFWASWCGPCKSFAPVFEQFALENENVFCCSVDCEKERALSEKFSVMSIPAVVLLKNGQEVQQSKGRLTIDQLKSLVD